MTSSDLPATSSDLPVTNSDADALVTSFLLLILLQLHSFKVKVVACSTTLRRVQLHSLVPSCRRAVSPGVRCSQVQPLASDAHTDTEAERDRSCFATGFLLGKDATRGSWPY